MQLEEAGALDWPLDSLKHYKNAKHDALEETADVTRKVSQIQERFDKANTFKQVGNSRIMSTKIFKNIVF